MALAIADQLKNVIDGGGWGCINIGRSENVPQTFSTGQSEGGIAYRLELPGTAATRVDKMAIRSKPAGLRVVTTLDPLPDLQALPVQITNVHGRNVLNTNRITDREAIAIRHSFS
jgi:hypothetical protein